MSRVKVTAADLEISVGVWERFGNGLSKTCAGSSQEILSASWWLGRDQAPMTGSEEGHCSVELDL